MKGVYYDEKIISLISATVVALMFAISFSAFGENDYTTKRDPNADKYITLADTIYINQVLRGSTIPPDLTQLDFDQNGLISAMDGFKIQLYLLKLVTVPDRNDNDPVITQFSSSRTYYRHDYSNNDLASYTSYTLSAITDINNSSSNNINNIIGSNDMVRDYDTSVVKLSIGGTGFIINNHIIATAAHCVYSQGDSEFIDITIDIVDSDNSVIKTLKPHYVHVPKPFTTQTSYNTTSQINDYALIYVDENLSDYGMFKMGLALDNYVNNGGQAIATGFPQVYPSGYENSQYGLRFKASGNILPNYTTSSLLRYDIDTAGGDSGGLVYVEEGVYVNGNLTEYKTVIAINTSQSKVYPYNTGVRINLDILRFFYSNDHLTS